MIKIVARRQNKDVRRRSVNTNNSWRDPFFSVLKSFCKHLWVFRSTAKWIHLWGGRRRNARLHSENFRSRKIITSEKKNF